MELQKESEPTEKLALVPRVTMVDLVSADALRLLDRQRTSQAERLEPLEVGRPVHHSQVRRWTQGADDTPKCEERPLLASAGTHALAAKDSVSSSRTPIHEMLAASITLSPEMEQILGDRAVTLALSCAGFILFVHGLQGIHQLAVNYFFKDYLKVSPATLSSVITVTWLPGVFEPLYGIATDAMPIMGYRRKPYLVLCGVVACASWILMATLVDQVWSALICMAVQSFAMCFTMVVTQALVVEKSRGKSQEYAGRLQTCVWGARETGALLSSFLGGWLLSLMTARDVFWLAALVPLSLIPVACLVEDECVGGSTSWSELEASTGIRSIYRTFCHPQIWKPCAFLLFFHATPSTGATWFYFYTDVTEFSSTFQGTMALVGSVFSLLGVFFFDAALRKVRFVSIILWGTLICSALGLSQIFLILRWNLEWGIPDKWFVLGEGAITGVVSWAISMPIFVLAARVCPKGLEATMYSMILGCNTLGWCIGTQLGSLLTWQLGITEHNLDHFWILVLVCHLSSLLPLLLIGWLSEDAVDDIDAVMNLPSTTHDTVGVEETLKPLQ